MLLACHCSRELTEETKADLAETQLGSNFVHSCRFRIVYQLKAVLSGILKHK